MSSVSAINKGQQSLRYFEGISGIPHFAMIRAAEATLLSSFLKNTLQPVLDLGCGDGTFSAAFELKDLYGIDLDIPSHANHSHYKEVKQANAAALPYADGFFGTVFSNCAVEHMDNLEQVTKEVARVLTPGGKFIFTVPADKFVDRFYSNSCLADLSLNNNAALDAYNGFHHHVNILSAKQWSQTLGEASFQVERMQYYLPYEFADVVICLDVLYTLTNERAKAALPKVERRLVRGLNGWRLRRRFLAYLAAITATETGSHLLIEATLNG